MLRKTVRRSESNRGRNIEERYFGFDRDYREKRDVLDLSKILLTTSIALSFAVGILAGATLFNKSGVPSALPYSTAPINLIVVGKPAFDGNTTTVTHAFRGAPNGLYNLEYSSNVNGPWESGDTHYSTEDGVFYVTLAKQGDKTGDWGKQMFFRVKNNT